MNLKSLIYIACCMAVMSCGTQKKKAMEETEVLIETSMGDMKVKLYNDTPKHRDNFIKLARAGAYDNILFHRVVRGFMVQTGDPALKPGGNETGRGYCGLPLYDSGGNPLSAPFP